MAGELILLYLGHPGFVHGPTNTSDYFYPIGFSINSDAKESKEYEPRTGTPYPESLGSFICNPG